MKTTEFRFCTRGSGNQEIRYSVIVVHGIGVTFIRIGSKRKPFFLMVPREVDDWLIDAGAEDLARIAVAQSFRDGLLNTHPQDAVDLDIKQASWTGDLSPGQWLYGSSVNRTQHGREETLESERKLEYMSE